MKDVEDIIRNHRDSLDVLGITPEQLREEEIKVSNLPPEKRKKLQEIAKEMHQFLDDRTILFIDLFMGKEPDLHTFHALGSVSSEFCKKFNCSIAEFMSFLQLKKHNFLKGLNMLQTEHTPVNKNNKKKFEHKEQHEEQKEKNKYESAMIGGTLGDMLKAKEQQKNNRKK